MGVSAAEFAASQEAVRRLEAHVASLTDEVTARRREVAELHVTMNRLLLALPAPALAEATSTNGRTHEDAAPTPGRRSWWQRILAWG